MANLIGADGSSGGEGPSFFLRRSVARGETVRAPHSGCKLAELVAAGDFEELEANV